MAVKRILRSVAEIDPRASLRSRGAGGAEALASQVSCLQALDGFVLVLSQHGDIVYCSENISDHLGVSQVEMVGQSVYEYSHPCDHEEVRDALRAVDGRRAETLVRFKCTLTGKGRNVHIKSASYKVIHVTGHVLCSENSAAPEEDGAKRRELGGCLVAVGRSIPHPANIEVPLGNSTFLSKHSMDMKFIYADDTLLKILGYVPEDLVGRSLYDFQHSADVAALAHHFKSLFSKGQCETGRYRLLARAGGYAWVQTQATLITDKHQKPISVVCVNHIISGVECKDEVFSEHQLRPVDLSLSEDPTDLPDGAIVFEAPESNPIVVTEKLFAPRNQDMNKGFLMFSPDEGLTVLKDEPEDLTHLAPTPGDACIPLGSSPFDMFDDFILGEPYCHLLDDDLTNGSPVGSLDADSLLLSSPEPQETDSSCGRASLLTDISLDAFDTDKADNECDEDNSLVAPNDGLPVLEPAVMWGALPDSVSLAKPQPSEGHGPSPAPALHHLLVTPTTGPPPQDIITNIYSDPGLLPNRSISWDTSLKRVMNQADEPSPKRAKHASLAKGPKAGAQSSSVLMNLLEMQQKLSSSSNIKTLQVKQTNLPSMTHLLRKIGKQTNNARDPMYCGAPNPDLIYNHEMDLNQKDLQSKYSNRTLIHNNYSSRNQKKEPSGVVQDNDSYFESKYEESSSFLNPNALLDSEEQTSLESSDFWIKSEVLQDTSKLLSALDDFKLNLC